MLSILCNSFILNKKSRFSLERIKQELVRSEYKSNSRKSNLYKFIKVS